MITITRVPSFADRFRTYVLMIDGVEVGRMKRGETIMVPAPAAGPHQIWISVDWYRSNKLDFVSGDAPLKFECESSLKGLKVLLTCLYVFLPSKWAVIRQIS